VVILNERTRKVTRVVFIPEKKYLPIFIIYYLAKKEIRIEFIKLTEELGIKHLTELLVISSCWYTN